VTLFSWGVKTPPEPALLLLAQHTVQPCIGLAVKQLKSQLPGKLYYAAAAAAAALLLPSCC